MTDPADRSGSALLDKVNHLLPILAELDKLTKRQAELQSRANDVAKSMLRTARGHLATSTDKADADLKRLRGTSHSLQASIATAQRNADRQRRALNAGVSQLQSSAEGLNNRRISDNRELDRMHRACDALTRTLFAALDRSVVLSRPSRAETQDDFELPEGAYDYIPLNVMRFLTLLMDAHELLSLDPDFAMPGHLYRPVKFLEVGCGTGRNILIAQAGRLLRIETCHGFEINSDQVDTGKTAFGLEDQLSAADAMTFDYSGYDVIFSYRPFENAQLQHALEQRFADTMDKGAYILSPLGYDLSLCPELTYVGGDGQIWKKTG